MGNWRDNWHVVAAVRLLTAVVWIFDIVTLPIYALIQWPWVTLARHNAVHAKKVPGTDCTYRSCDPPNEMTISMERLKLRTIPKLVQYSIFKHSDKNCLGTRPILSEENQVQHNGKVFKKYTLGQYQWISYREFGQRVDWFGGALRELGLQPKQKLCIFAETRAEWMITAIGALNQNITVTTLYTALGEDAIVHGMNETEVTHLVTTHDLMPKVKAVLDRCPHVTHVIYMEDQSKKGTDVSGIREGIRVLSFSETMKLGESTASADKEAEPPAPSDLAVLMYTSGSTGTPKGVQITHAGLVQCLTMLAQVVRIRNTDVYLGYLPLAHVLELCAETCALMFGVPIGYSSPLTLFDNSSKLKRGCQGDAAALKPTLMAAVPLILDRIVQGIRYRMSSTGPLAEAVFEWALDYRNAWRRRGFNTPILHRLLFSHSASLLGGRVRAIAVGGAPLSETTHDTIRSCFGVVVLQGYGLTETSGVSTIMDPYDLSVGEVGHPVHCCEIRLADWEEGGYRTTDKPRPRGEVFIGGEHIAMGYYKLTEKSAEAFFEEGGKRWLRSGDIGEMYPNGNLKIIDRKKDLVKLQAGEYISLGRVEAILKTSALVGNLFVYADPARAHVIAVVLPETAALWRLAREVLGPDHTVGSLEELCKNDKMEQAVQKQLAETGVKGGLDKWEIPRRVALTSILWTPENNLVTAALKLKRKELSVFYRAELERLYSLD